MGEGRRRRGIYGGSSTFLGLCSMLSSPAGGKKWRGEGKKGRAKEGARSSALPPSYSEAGPFFLMRRMASSASREKEQKKKKKKKRKIPRDASLFVPWEGIGRSFFHIAPVPPRQRRKGEGKGEKKEKRKRGKGGGRGEGGKDGW